MSQVSPADAGRRAEVAQARRRVTTPASIGLLLLRLGLGALLFLHGLAGALHLDRFTEQVRAADDPVPVRASVSAAVVVVLALLLAVFVAVGFLTRVAAGLLVVLTGLVWYSVHHADGAFVALADLQQTLRGETVIDLGLVGLALVFTGPGRFAVDAGFRRSRAGSGSDRSAAAGDDTRGGAWSGDTTIVTAPGDGKRSGGKRGTAKAAERALPDDPSAWTDEDFKRL